MTTTLSTLSAAPSASSYSARLAAAWRQHRGWLWTDVVSVFLFTRAALVVVGQFAGNFASNLYYPVAIAPQRGWLFTPYRLLDVWGRWDSGWYFDVILHGYYARGDIRTVQSNLPFFPLFPYTVKALLTLVPPSVRPPGVILLLGVLVSNAFLLGGLMLVRQWVMRLTGDAATARRTVLYLLLFPTSFILSAFYAESMFLFFMVAALFAAQRRAWFWACLAGALATLARPLGVFIGVPLAWQYAEQAGWNIRNLRWNVIWLALIPAAFLAFCYWQYTLTGDFLASVHGHEAWGRGFAWPWETLLRPTVVIDYLTPLEQAMTVVFLAGALAVFWRLRSVSLGLFALLLVVPGLFTGQLTSSLRFYAVVLPVFVVAGQLGRHPKVDRGLTIVLPMAQALLFFVWCIFYWVA